MFEISNNTYKFGLNTNIVNIKFKSANARLKKKS